MKSIYEYGKCSYCDEINRVTRPTPFMADVGVGAMMCESCWEDTRKEYANSNGEIIDKFNSCDGYEEAKEQVVTDESLKEILGDFIQFSDQDSPIEELALNRIKKLELQNRELMHIIEQIKECKYEPDKVFIYVDRALAKANGVE